MSIKPGNQIRRERAEAFWSQVWEDNKKLGLTPSEIARKYRNKSTGKNYTREHIHYVLRKFRSTNKES